VGICTHDPLAGPVPLEKYARYPVSLSAMALPEKGVDGRVVDVTTWNPAARSMRSAF
jgi:hypothetical protein